jgi:hypothetical protein
MEPGHDPRGPHDRPRPALVELATDEPNTSPHQSPQETQRSQTVVVVLILQPHLVILGLSALVVGLSGAVLVASAPAGPGPGEHAVGQGHDQVCQKTLDLSQRDWDEAAARAFGAITAVMAR